MATKKAPAKKAPAKQAAAPKSQTVDRSKLKKARALSVPMVKFNAGDEYALEIQEVAWQQLQGGGTKKKNSAMILLSVNLETGEQGRYIAPALLQSALANAYGDGEDFPDDYVGPDEERTSLYSGKRILIECSKREGKRYMDVAVWELE